MGQVQKICDGAVYLEVCDMKKIFMYILISLVILSSGQAVFAGEHEKEIAKQVGTQLVNLFQPDAVSVTISNGGSFAWAEATGAVIDNIRMENMKLSAMLREIPKEVKSGDKYELARLVMMSEGEAVLLEKDVNAYFQKGIDTSGFSNLKFDFSPEGFKASGMFSAKFIFNIRIRLSAEGKLGLEPDGIYLKDSSIFIEGVKQPDSLTNMIVGRVNPLLPFSKIPFPVKFRNIKMTDTSAVITSDLRPFQNGETWSWKK